MEASKDLDQAQYRTQKFDKFEGDAVRTDKKMRSSTSTYKFRGHFGGGGRWRKD